MCRRTVPLVQTASTLVTRSHPVAANTRRPGWLLLSLPLCSVLAVGLASATPAGAVAQDVSRPRNTALDVDFRFAMETRQELKRMHETIVTLARKELQSQSQPRARLRDQIQKFAAAADTGRPRELSRTLHAEDLANLEILARSAASEYENAELTREVAEIGVKEYDEGIFVQEKAVAERTLRAARGLWTRAEDRVREARERLDRLKRASTGSTADLGLEADFADQLAAAEREERTSASKMRQAESALDVLLEYTKPKRMKELKAEVAKAKRDEFLKQARAQSLQAALKRRDQAAASEGAPPRASRVLGVLDKAIPIEEQIRSKLHEFSRSAKPDPALRQEIEKLTGQLRERLARAEMESDAADSGRLYDRVHAAARAGSQRPPK
jgi:hypothetical protein